MSKLSEKKKLIVLVASILVVLVAVTALFVVTVCTPVAKTSDGEVVKAPYSLKIDGEEVALLKSKKEGKDALSEVVEEYTPDDTTLKKVDFDKKIKIEKRKIKPFEKLDTVKEEEELKEALISKNESEEPLFTATVVSEKKQEKDIEPKVKFKYSDDLDIYEYKVEKKGKKGKKEILYEWTSKNGDVTDKDKKDDIVTEQSVDAVVVTGSDETPKDLKWKDYKKFQKEVAKEYSDAIIGDKMIVYGEKHLGAPYKRGGKSYKTGIDCVAFVRDVYRKYGIILPKGRSALGRVGKGVSLKNAKKGDIVYYGDHVAIYYGNGKVIHAIRKGISISRINYRKWKTIRHVKK